MANSKSAEKRTRQAEKRRERRKPARSRIRSATREFHEALEGGNVEEAEEAYVEVTAVLDRAARKGIIPKERASRKKGRLAKKLDEIR